MKILLITVLLFFCALSPVDSQQLNCECFKNDSLSYLACKDFMNQCFGDNDPLVFYQGSRASQKGMDRILNFCPSFSYAYYTKSIPYLKRGEFITWKQLIDKAVEYNPFDYLGYRGGSRFMFLRDYSGALQDIEEFERIVDYDIGYIYNGDYHLVEIKALCYRAIGDNCKAVDILSSYLEKDCYSLFGQFHLGILYFENAEFKKSISALKKQLDVNPFAETYYYLAKIYKSIGNEIAYRQNIDRAMKEYKAHNIMSWGFMDYPDKIYLKDIKLEYYKK